MEMAGNSTSCAGLGTPDMPMYLPCEDELWLQRLIVTVTMQFVMCCFRWTTSGSLPAFSC